MAERPNCPHGALTASGQCSECLRAQRDAAEATVARQADRIMELEGEMQTLKAQRDAQAHAERGAFSKQIGKVELELQATRHHAERALRAVDPPRDGPPFGTALRTIANGKARQAEAAIREHEARR